MELPELNADERIALVGLVKATVLADGRSSEDEQAEVQGIVAALGEAEYQRSLDAFETRFPDEAGFKHFLKTIAREDARDLIYGTVLEAAAADVIEGSESDLLSWLAEAWNIRVVPVEE